MVSGGRLDCVTAFGIFVMDGLWHISQSFRPFGAWKGFTSLDYGLEKGTYR